MSAQPPTQDEKALSTLEDGTQASTPVLDQGVVASSNRSSVAVEVDTKQTGTALSISTHIAVTDSGVETRPDSVSSQAEDDSDVDQEDDDWFVPKGHSPGPMASINTVKTTVAADKPKPTVPKPPKK